MDTRRQSKWLAKAYFIVWVGLFCIGGVFRTIEQATGNQVFGVATGIVAGVICLWMGAPLVLATIASPLGRILARVGGTVLFIAGVYVGIVSLERLLAGQ
jgi:hypothetical protein